jgi:hypothetical protein
VVEDHHGVAAGGPAGDLDRVLHRLGAGVEQRRALVVIAGGEPVELLADLHVALVGGDHEAGVGERRDLLDDPVNDQFGAVADRGHRDPGAEVDQRVAVHVHHDPAARGGHEDRQHVAQPARDAALAALQ